MCCSCGCGRPLDDHGDPRHIVLGDMEAAAAAAGISVETAAENIVDTLALPDPKAVFAAAFDTPTLVCDVDGVLAFYAEAACAAVNAAFGTSWAAWQWTDWSGPFSATQDAFLVEARRDPAFWATVAPDTQAIAALRSIGEATDVVIATERPRKTARITQTWLDTYGVPYSALHVVGHGRKPQVIAEYAALRPLVVVDDNPARWADVAFMSGLRLFCPRRPYTPPAQANVVVFDDWGVVKQAVGAPIPFAASVGG